MTIYKGMYTGVYKVEVPNTNPDEIIKIVCKELNVPVKCLSGKTRRREIVFARQLAMYFIKANTHFSLKSIGERFPYADESAKGRDHTTVIHSVQTIKDLMDTDPVILHQVKQIGARI